MAMSLLCVEPSRHLDAMLQTPTLRWYFFPGLCGENIGYRPAFLVDVNQGSYSDVRDRSVSLSDLIRRAGRARLLNLIILDACRDFVAQAGGGTPTALANACSGKASSPSIEQAGRATSNTVIAYSAQADTTALESHRRNSAFTSALVGHLQKPDVDLATILLNVSADVNETTRGAQRPWIKNLDLAVAIYFAPAKSPTTIEASNWAAARRIVPNEVTVIILLSILTAFLHPKHAISLRGLYRLDPRRYRIRRAHA